MAQLHKPLTDKMLERVAERFRLMGDPVRLRLLQALTGGERSVAALCVATGSAQANVSKHLQLLLHGGLVHRRRAGLFVYYALADPRIFSLCDAVCGSLTDQLQRELTALGAAPTRAPGRATRVQRRTSR